MLIGTAPKLGGEHSHALRDKLIAISDLNVTLGNVPYFGCWILEVWIPEDMLDSVNRVILWRRLVSDAAASIKDIAEEMNGGSVVLGTFQQDEDGYIELEYLESEDRMIQIPKYVLDCRFVIYPKCTYDEWFGEDE